MVKKILFIFLFFLIYSGFALAQGDKVSIKGQILDDNNNPIPNAVIVFNDQVGDFIETVKTDAKGIYQAIVPPGTYSITADAPEELGFASITFNNKKILSDEEINFRLTEALPDQSSPTSTTNIVFYGLIATVVLGISGFGGFLYIKTLKRK